MWEAMYVQIKVFIVAGHVIHVIAKKLKIV